MKFIFTVKVKDKHNPPIFNEKLDRGILAIYIIEIKSINEDDLQNPMIISKLLDQARELSEDWIEVNYETIKENEIDNKIF